MINCYYLQVRSFAPIGMMEYWNIGKMGLGILGGWVNGPPKAERSYN
jgi:hypothetical protein